jgi:LSD1 subclass zinc finger protein
MPIMLLCPNLRCRKLLSVPDDTRGKTVKCQHCQTMVRVPEKAAAPATPAGAAAAAAAKK